MTCPILVSELSVLYQCKYVLKRDRLLSVISWGNRFSGRYILPKLRIGLFFSQHGVVDDIPPPPI